MDAVKKVIKGVNFHKAIIEEKCGDDGGSQYEVLIKNNDPLRKSEIRLNGFDTLREAKNAIYQYWHRLEGGPYVPYPSSIEQAAEILDALSPGWEKKINCQELNPSSVLDCVLGQVFSVYMAGLEELFGRKMALSASITDEIFGSNASTLDWIRQVLGRLGQTTAEQDESPTESLPLLRVIEVKTRYIDIPAMRLSLEEKDKVKALIAELNKLIQE